MKRLFKKRRVSREAIKRNWKKVKYDCLKKREARQKKPVHP